MWGVWLRIRAESHVTQFIPPLGLALPSTTAEQQLCHPAPPTSPTQQTAIQFVLIEGPNWQILNIVPSVSLFLATMSRRIWDEKRPVIWSCCKSSSSLETGKEDKEEESLGHVSETPCVAFEMWEEGEGWGSSKETASEPGSKEIDVEGSKNDMEVNRKCQKAGDRVGEREKLWTSASFLKEDVCLCWRSWERRWWVCVCLCVCVCVCLSVCVCLCVVGGMEGERKRGRTSASLKAIIPGAGVIRLVTRFAGPCQHISGTRDQICDLPMHFNFRPQ